MSEAANIIRLGKERDEALARIAALEAERNRLTLFARACEKAEEVARADLNRANKRIAELEDGNP